jgi:hemolysin activation/secretion protein
MAAIMFACIGMMPSLSQAVETYTTPTSPRFDIARFQIEGNTLIPAGELDAIVAPYTGKSKDFGDVQSAMQALQQAYQQLGYQAVRVILPEQTLENGVIRVNIIQQKIAKVEVLNNHFFDDTNILNTVPALRIGEPPNARAVASNLRVANENPAKYASVHFKTNEQDPDSIDATVRVIDEKPQKYFLTLDNTGNEQTKDIRIGIGYQNYNLFNRDHRFSAQFITTPQSDLGFSDMRIFGFGYSIPLYSLGDSIDFLAAYSDVDAGTLLNGALNITSKGTVFGAHYNWNLDRIGNYQHKLNFGLDYRDYDPEVTFGGFNLTPEVSVLPVSATYSAMWKNLERQVSVNAGVIHNIASVTSHSNADDHASPPWLAEDDFTRYVWGIDFTEQIATTWQLHLSANGQFASDHLHPGEQFGLGGMDSVRGWHERAFTGDKGYRASVEIVSPNFGGNLASGLSLKALAFYDFGHLSNMNNVFGDPVGNSLTIGSVGAGLRFGYGKHLLGRVDAALVVDGDVTESPSASYTQSRDDGDSFIHFSMAWVW